MKTKIGLLCATLLAVAFSLRADPLITNTNAVDWGNADSGSILNTSYNDSGDPMDVLNLKLTVDSGYQLDFNTLDLFFGYSGGGTGDAPSPYLQVVDSDNNILSTSPTVPVTTEENAAYYFSGQSAAEAFRMEFAAPSTLSLDAGTYYLQIWDTGEQLSYVYGAAASITGVSVTDATYGLPPWTPAFELGGSLIEPAPEPSVVALMSLGGVGLVWINQKRRRNV
jgi:hypothetical protein